MTRLNARAKGGLRAVAEPVCKLGDRRAFFLERVERELHPPTGQVLHRGLIDELAEPGGEPRARHRELAGERGERPGARWVAVDERHRTADLAVAQSPDPARARRRVGLDPGADRL